MCSGSRNETEVNAFRSLSGSAVSKLRAPPLPEGQDCDDATPADAAHASQRVHLCSTNQGSAILWAKSGFDLDIFGVSGFKEIKACQNSFNWLSLGATHAFFGTAASRYFWCSRMRSALMPLAASFQCQERLVTIGRQVSLSRWEKGQEKFLDAAIQYEAP